MHSKLRGGLVATTAAAGLALGGFGLAAAVSGGASETPVAPAPQQQGDDGEHEDVVTGPAADRAAQAALEQVATAGAVVDSVQAGDVSSVAWEVGVTLPDGSQVEVTLAEDLTALDVQPDEADGEDGDDGAEDRDAIEHEDGTHEGPNDVDAEAED